MFKTSAVVLSSLIIILVTQFPSRANATGICDRTPQIKYAITKYLSKQCSKIDAEDLQKVKSLSVSESNNLMTGLKDGDFDGLSAMETLSLRGNLISVLRPDTFRGLGQLKHLELKYNTIQLIQRNAFRGLPSLEILNASWIRDWLGGTAKPTQIEVGAFTGLTALKELILTYNVFLPLPAGAFGGMPQLQKLWFGESHFSGLAPDVFLGLDSLHTLDFTMSKITTGGLPAGVFHGLSFLGNLSLANIQITGKIEPGFQAGLTSLGWLNLSGKKLGSLSPDFFSYTPQLEAVDLAGNDLTSLPEGLFAPTIKTLRSINLKDNQLTTLPKDLFANFVEGQINLSNNKLSVLPDGIFQNLTAGWIIATGNQLSHLQNDLFDIDCFRGAKFDFTSNPLQDETIRRLKPLLCDRIQMPQPNNL